MFTELDSNLKWEMNKYILHLETATKVCSVALSNNGQIISCKESVSDAYIHSEALTLFIEDVIKDANIELTQLAAISVSAGPGSYTGLRIGISTAKGLCFALNIPLISIDSLQALKELIPNPQMNIIPMLDARRMEVYTEVYSPNDEILLNLDAVVIDEHLFEAYEPFIVLGDGASKCKEIWQHRNIVWKDEVISSAVGQARIAFNKFQASNFENVAYFSPIYLKDANGIRR